MCRKSCHRWILQPWYCQAVAVLTVLVLCSALCHTALFCWTSWTSVDIPVLTALLLSAEASNAFPAQRKRIQKGRKSWGGKWVFTPLLSSSVGSTFPLHKRLLEQSKSAGAGDQKSGKGSLGRGAILSRGEDCLMVRSLVPHWSGERKENSAPSCAVAPSVGLFVP